MIKIFHCMKLLFLLIPVAMGISVNSLAQNHDQQLQLDFKELEINFLKNDGLSTNNFIEARKFFFNKNFIIDLVSSTDQPSFFINVIVSDDYIHLKNNSDKLGLNFAYPINKIPGINLLKQIKSENLLFNINEEVIESSFDHLSFSTLNGDFRFKDMQYLCDKTKINNESMLSCLNNMKIDFNNEDEINLIANIGNKEIPAIVEELKIEPSRFGIKTKEINYFSKNFNFAVHNFSGFCNKGQWDFKIGLKTIISNCLEDSDISFDNVYVRGKDINIDFRLREEGFYFTEKHITIEGELKANFSGFNLYLNDFVAKCLRTLDIYNFEYQDIYKSCLINTQVIPGQLKITHPELGKKKTPFQLETRLNLISSSPGSLSLKGQNLLVDNGANHVSIPFYNFSCQRHKTFAESLLPFNLIEGCMKDSQFQIPQIIIKNSEIDLDGRVSISDFRTTYEKHQLVGNNMSFKIKDTLYKVDNYNLNCKKELKSGNFTFDEFITGRCFERGHISLNEFSIENKFFNLKSFDSKRKGPVSSHEKGVHFDLGPNKLSFQTPFLAVQTDKYQMHFSDLELFCDREKDVNGQFLTPVNPKFKEGCFKNSKLTLSEAKIFGKDKNRMELKLDAMELNKDRIQAHFPSFEYEFINKKGKTMKVLIENITAKCKIGANMELLKVLDWQTLLQNCISGAEINIATIKMAEGKTDYKEKVWNLKLKTHKNQEGQDRFDLSVKVPVLFGVKTNKAFDGKIYYEKENKNIKLRLDGGDIFDNMILSLFAPSFTDKDGRNIFIPVGPKKN